MKGSNEERLVRLLELTSGQIFVLQAECAALRGALKKIAEASLPSAEAASLMNYLNEQKAVEIERMILNLGDQRPDVADGMQKILDELRGGKS